MSLLVGPDLFVLGIAAGVLGLVFLLSLIVARAYDEPTLFFLAAYVFFIVAALLAGERSQLAKDLVENLLLILGCLAVAGLQGWILRSRKTSRLHQLIVVFVIFASVGLAGFYGLSSSQSGDNSYLAVGLPMIWASLVFLAVFYLTSQSWDAAGPWKWWLLLGQVAGLVVAAFFLSNLAESRQAFWPVVLMLLVQTPPIYLSLVWRSRLLNEARLRSSAAGVADPLTGLSTTPVLIERLMRVMARTQQAKTMQSSNALYLIEVQNWRGLLAELGPDFNEKLLLESAMRLRRSVGDNDMVARIAGGRFAVVAQGLAGQNDITDLATRLVVSGLRIDSPLLPGVELKFRIIVLNLKLTAPLALPIAQAWLDSLLSRFQAWPPSHRTRSILVIEQEDDVTERFEANSNY